MSSSPSSSKTHFYLSKLIRSALYSVELSQVRSAESFQKRKADQVTEDHGLSGKAFLPTESFDMLSDMSNSPGSSTVPQPLQTSPEIAGTSLTIVGPTTTPKVDRKPAASSVQSTSASSKATARKPILSTVDHPLHLELQTHQLH